MAVNTTNMGLRSWNLANDFFSYSELASNWTLVDAHDHTTGKGLQIPTGGIANLAIDTTKLAASAVTGAKIAPATITADRLAASAITSANSKLTIGQILSTADVSLPASPSFIDLTGTQTTIVLTVPSIVLVRTVIDLEAQITGTQAAQCYLNVNGSDQTRPASLTTTSYSRATVAGDYMLSLAAGSHILKLRGNSTNGNAAGTVAIAHSGSGYTYWVAAQ